MWIARELLLAGDSLALFPHRGCPGLAEGTQEVVTVWPYLIVYEADADLVRILRIWHRRRIGTDYDDCLLKPFMSCFVPKGR